MDGMVRDTKRHELDLVIKDAVCTDLKRDACRCWSTQLLCARPSMLKWCGARHSSGHALMK